MGAGVDDFRFFVVLPAQTLAAAVTKRHEFPLHRDQASGAHIKGGFSDTVRKHHEFGNWFGGTVVQKGKKNMPKGIW